MQRNTEKQSTEKRDEIMQYAEDKLNAYMEEWCGMECSGGEMRGQRGCNIERFVRKVINKIGKLYDIDFTALNGNDDKKELKIPNTEISKQHQVDVHVYLDGKFVAAIECKAYLDSCYYVRACDDFHLFKRFNYDVKNYIFALENSIKDETKMFTDHTTENICDDVFYVLDGKRSSAKPIYIEKYRKSINKKLLATFIDSMLALGVV